MNASDGWLLVLAAFGLAFTVLVLLADSHDDNADQDERDRWQP